MKKNKLINTIIFAIIFVAGILSSLYIWPRINLPFSNPWDVVGPLAIKKFNPANNIIRFIFLICFPSVLLICINFFKKFDLQQNFETIYHSKYNLSINQFHSPSLKFFLYFFSTIGIIVFQSSFPNNFDSFHEGEGLGTAISYFSGKIPYKDFIFCHGVIEDPLRAPFLLIGKSIGAVRAYGTLLTLITNIFFTYLIFKIFNKNLYVSFLIIILFQLLSRNFYLDVFFQNAHKYLIFTFFGRDVTTYSFLITVLHLNDILFKEENTTINKIKAVFFFLSFIPLFSFGYSIDRGFYLFASYLIIFPLTYFLFIHKSIYKKVVLSYTMLGIILGIIILGILLKGNFIYFIKYAFFEMPKYKELLDGAEYPIKETSYFFICVLIALNMFWLSIKLISNLNEKNKSFKSNLILFVTKYFVEISLLIVSVFFFRSALGRTDWPHVAYNSHITYFLTIYILFKHYLLNFRVYNLIKSYILIIVFIFSVIYIYKIYNEKLISKLMPINTPDSYYIPKNYVKTISFLKTNLKKNENFYTLTSEASWFYFIDKPCPTRFPVLWFASPYFYQQELIVDLRKNNVKYILYKNNQWTNVIDGITNDWRFPIVLNYINNNYSFHKKIDDNEIWIHKNYLSE